MNVSPFRCKCGRKIHFAESTKAKPVKTDGHRKAAICRSNQCGNYNADTDTCDILTDRGLAGRIGWLYSNPDAGCADKADPKF